MKRINTRKKIVFFTAINVNVNKDTTSVSHCSNNVKKNIPQKSFKKSPTFLVEPIMSTLM
jgi:hypothetical protein